ncbi:uncharacterized protein LOC127138040 [Lathyrus oleraceus]|uniref:uncharacterized protein LOC127138040 n=1 Tax=Pisum sativum TaxID=3888 RepID=UPI0021D0855A|nr:uncharacterized protein LOC127138040 [Pisum sativum]
MACTEAQKVQFGTHMLSEEVGGWWKNVRQRLEIIGAEITWVVFITKFLKKYFPEDVRSKKEIEFLELKHGNMIVVEYAAKFEELKHENETAEGSKYIKFESGLCPEIKIYDEDNKARPAYYKILSEKKGKNQNHGKPYSAPVDKGKKKALDENKLSEGETLASIKCFKCGVAGHRANDSKNSKRRCFKCGKIGHLITDCKRILLTCINYREPGLVITHFHKPKKVQCEGKVFALTGLETTSTNKLIWGTCFITGISLIAIIDMGAMHSFISLECDRRLNLEFSSMVGSMIIDTLALVPITTSWTCFNFPLTIYGKNFMMDLVCLPLNKFNVILKMNWLEFNRVHINYLDKSLSFPKYDASDELFVSAKHVDELMKNDDKGFMILDSMKDERKPVICELIVVCNFPEVFPYDINDLPPEREVEFAIDLVPDTSHVLMAPYGIYASELSELKKQLEEFLEKKFV